MIPFIERGYFSLDRLMEWVDDLPEKPNIDGHGGCVGRVRSIHNPLDAKQLRTVTLVSCLAAEDLWHRCVVPLGMRLSRLGQQERGLAGNQIGLEYQVALVRDVENPDKTLLLVNPTIERLSDVDLVAIEEDSSSRLGFSRVPYLVRNDRCERIKVTYQAYSRLDDGSYTFIPQEELLDGAMSVRVQHYCGYLAGKPFMDIGTSVKRIRESFMRKVSESNEQEQERDPNAEPKAAAPNVRRKSNEQKRRKRIKRK